MLILFFKFVKLDIKVRAFSALALASSPLGKLLGLGTLDSDDSIKIDILS